MVTQTTNPLDIPGRLFYLELLNPNARAASTKNGPVYRISFEIDQPTFQMFMDAAGNIRLIGKMAVVGDDETGVSAVESPTTAPKPKKEGRPKGPHGLFWEALYHSGFCHHPDVRQWISTNEQTSRAAFTKTIEHEAADREALCGAFQVPSRTFISPTMLMGLAATDFPGAIPLIEQAERKAIEKEDRERHDERR